MVPQIVTQITFLVERSHLNQCHQDYESLEADNARLNDKLTSMKAEMDRLYYYKEL